MKISQKLFLTILLSFTAIYSNAQLADSCKLDMGINLAGISDYSSELPFANLMKISRTWYTKGVNDNSYTFNTDLAESLTYDTNGYPTHIPQSVVGEPLLQKVATIWDGTDSWPSGKYSLLWDGTGDFEFWGDYTNLVKINNNKYEFDHVNTVDGILELIMISSDISDPVTNIRLLLPGTENTYETQPFNQTWLNLLEDFSTLRFMDWGHTNFWGQPDPYTWQYPTLLDWNERANKDYYTYAGNKGVPYELMIDLLNHLDVDGWVCVPHRASDNYIQQMANYFRDNLETDKKLYVEYSNEIWNWIFGQAQWLNEYSCNGGNSVWPECIVPKIQNTLDIWTSSFTGQMDRIRRVAAIQTGWLDVSERVVYNLNPNSFDVVSPTFYFGFQDNSETMLDALGSNATVEDIAYYARQGIPNEYELINNIKSISDSLNVPMAFYEGGQHLTPIPFGSVPSYETALLDAQRDISMYNIYNEWLDTLRNLNTSEEALLLMHFSFITPLSAQYGSWGLLESMEQDTALIPAPKYAAILNNIACQQNTVVADVYLEQTNLELYPNPTAGVFTIKGQTSDYTIRILDSTGNLYQNLFANQNEDIVIDINLLPAGLYLVSIESSLNGNVSLQKIIKF